MTSANVIDYMAKSTADSTLFPDDKLFEYSVTKLPLYNRLAQYKVRTILEALDCFALSQKSENIPLPNGLTIEHVMPQKWLTNWPLPPSNKSADPLEELDQGIRRESLINTLGNLTLITSSLNPALSNSDWETKRPELLKFSKLNLTQYFHGEHANIWDEDAIELRSKHLYLQMIAIWPSLPKNS